VCVSSGKCRKQQFFYTGGNTRANKCGVEKQITLR
jgi:hypothetical protein